MKKWVRGTAMFMAIVMIVVWSANTPGMVSYAAQSGWQVLDNPKLPVDALYGVQNNILFGKKNGKVAIVGGDMKLVKKTAYTRYEFAVPGGLMVSRETEEENRREYAQIDKNGEVVYELGSYSSLKRLESHSDRVLYLVTRTDGQAVQYGLVDEKGQIRVPVQQDDYQKYYGKNANIIFGKLKKGTMKYAVYDDWTAKTNYSYDAVYSDKYDAGVACVTKNGQTGFLTDNGTVTAMNDTNPELGEKQVCYALAITYNGLKVYAKMFAENEKTAQKTAKEVKEQMTSVDASENCMDLEGVQWLLANQEGEGYKLAFYDEQGEPYSLEEAFYLADYFENEDVLLSQAREKMETVKDTFPGYANKELTDTGHVYGGNYGNKLYVTLNYRDNDREYAFSFFYSAGGNLLYWGENLNAFNSEKTETVLCDEENVLWYMDGNYRKKLADNSKTVVHTQGTKDLTVKNGVVTGEHFLAFPYCNRMMHAKDVMKKGEYYTVVVAAQPEDTALSVRTAGADDSDDVEVSDDEDTVDGDNEEEDDDEDEQDLLDPGTIYYFHVNTPAENGRVKKIELVSQIDLTEYTKEYDVSVYDDYFVCRAPVFDSQNNVSESDGTEDTQEEEDNWEDESVEEIFRFYSISNPVKCMMEIYFTGVEEAQLIQNNDAVYFLTHNYDDKAELYDESGQKIFTADEIALFATSEGSYFLYQVSSGDGDNAEFEQNTEEESTQDEDNTEDEDNTGEDTDEEDTYYGLINGSGEVVIDAAEHAFIMGYGKEGTDSIVFGRYNASEGKISSEVYTLVNGAWEQEDTKTTKTQTLSADTYHKASYAGITYKKEYNCGENGQTLTVAEKVWEETGDILAEHEYTYDESAHNDGDGHYIYIFDEIKTIIIVDRKWNGKDTEDNSDTEENPDMEEPTDTEENPGMEEPTDTEENPGMEEPTDTEENPDIEQPSDTEENPDTEQPTDTEEDPDDGEWSEIEEDPSDDSESSSTSRNPSGSGNSGSDSTTRMPSGSDNSGNDSTTRTPSGSDDSGNDSTTRNPSGSGDSGNDSTTRTPSGSGDSGSDSTTQGTPGLLPSGNNLSNPHKDSNGSMVYDYVYFGNYQQSGTQPEPIKWKVLSVNGNDAFLVSDKILDVQQYYAGLQPAAVGWQESTLRSWLNGYDAKQNAGGIDYSADNFINKAFTEQEKQSLLSMNTSDIAGQELSDKVALLSYQDIMNVNYGFTANANISDTAKMCYDSNYVLNSAIAQNSDSMLVESDSPDYWWIRSTVGTLGNTLLFVTEEGTVEVETAAGTYYGICPAIHLDISGASYTDAGESAANADKGTGTVSDTTSSAANKANLAAIWAQLLKESEEEEQDGTEKSAKKTTEKKTHKITISDIKSKKTTKKPSKVTGLSLKKEKPKKKKGKNEKKTTSPGMKVSWKQAKNKTGYQLKYATNKKFTKAKTKNTKKKTLTLKKLKNKTYYVKVRAYSGSGSSKKYGSWSKTKKLKLK